MAPNFQDRPLKFLRSKRGLTTIVVFVVLALFLIRPGADRLKSRVTRSISQELRRPVDVGSVSLRLLPAPGFELKNFVLYDAQDFGAEPMMQSAEVSANLRMSSLLRGRLEIARLNLTEPSINLVRNSEGHWNLESLLERAAQSPMAPTVAGKSASRASFPYVEADQARINLKIGQEKKSYALTNADFSFWQDAEDTWAMRLKAEPVRTDFNLSDTGQVQVNGSWKRASNLRDTPVQFTMQWSDAQLGQATKLFYGKDKGWRGSLKLAATLTGTPGDLSIATAGSVQDFRRYDILVGDAIRLQATCTGHYSTAEKNLTKLLCRAPIQEGSLRLAGEMNGLPAAKTYELSLNAENLPVSSVGGLLVHIKKDLPPDFAAAGNLNASIKLQRQEDSAPVWSGGGEIVNLKLQSPQNDTDLNFRSVPFTVAPASEEEDGNDNNRIALGTITLPLGRPASTTVHGWVSSSGYSLSLQGDSQVNKLMQLARTLGLRSPQIAADGLARVDLQVAGNWTGFAPPVVTGKAVLHSIRAEVRGVNAPIEIASGTVVLTPNNINVLYLVAATGPTQWKGAVAIPRPCIPPDACPVHFDLRVDHISTDELFQLVNPSSGKRPWYKFLSPNPQSGTPYLLTLQGSGKLAANRLEIQGLTANRVSATVDFEQGKLRISDMTAEILGGQHTGELRADFTGKVPEYSGSGSLNRIALRQLADAMHDYWISGTATMRYKINAKGLSRTDLFASADGVLQIDASDAVLTHLTLPGSAVPLHLRSLTSRMALRHGIFEVQEGKLETAGGIYQVSGTASLGRVLDMKLVRDGQHGFSVSGPLNDPKVTPAANAETQAALKP